MAFPWAAAISAVGSLIGSSKSSSSSSKNSKYYNNLLKDIYGSLYDNLSAEPDENPYLDLYGDTTSNILNKGYSYYTDDELQNMYNSQAADYEDIFKGQSDTLSARMASRGLSGSGVYEKAFGDLSTYQADTLTDLYDSIQQQNVDLTNEAQTNAYNNLAMLSQLYSSQQSSALNDYYRLANLLNSSIGSNNGAGNNNDIWGTLLGSSLSSLFSSLGK